MNKLGAIDGTAPRELTEQELDAISGGGIVADIRDAADAALNGLFRWLRDTGYVNSCTNPAYHHLPGCGG